MADTKMLIVVKNDEAGEAYAHALSEIGVACDIVPSFHEMSGMAMENAYNGLIVDIFTLVRCSKEEKAIAYDCMNFYPVLRVKWENRHKKIMLSPLEQAFTPDAGSALKSFVESRCGSFPARVLRRHQRKQIHLNVLFSQEGGFSPVDGSRAFTVNVSRGGIFLHTMQGYRQGKTLWLRFIELADSAPVAASVRWSLDWGRARCIPGIGMQFQGLSEGQEREIRRMFES